MFGVYAPYPLSLLDVPAIPSRFLLGPLATRKTNQRKLRKRRRSARPHGRAKR